MKLGDNFLFFSQILVISYEITVFTGDVKEAGTKSKYKLAGIDNDVTVTIYGSGGATPEVKLGKGDGEFERGTVDHFRMELEDVGKLRKIRIGHEGKGNRGSWYLDKVELCILRMTYSASYKLFVLLIQCYYRRKPKLN